MPSILFCMLTYLIFSKSKKFLNKFQSHYHQYCYMSTPFLAIRPSRYGLLMSAILVPVNHPPLTPLCNQYTRPVKQGQKNRQGKEQHKSCRNHKWHLLYQSRKALYRVVNVLVVVIRDLAESSPFLTGGERGFLSHLCIHQANLSFSFYDRMAVVKTRLLANSKR